MWTDLSKDIVELFSDVRFDFRGAGSEHQDRTFVGGFHVFQFEDTKDAAERVRKWRKVNRTKYLEARRIGNMTSEQAEAHRAKKRSWKPSRETMDRRNAKARAARAAKQAAKKGQAS